eukprot:COSAG05_NODE_1406_length_4967_cov_7.938180_3_plen_101_part_00
MIVAVDDVGNLTIFFENGTELLSRKTALPADANRQLERDVAVANTEAAVANIEVAETDDGPRLNPGVVAIASSTARALGQYLALTTVHTLHISSLMLSCV